MIDLYLFNTVMNTIWYIFTILFVLYRFTSFFSYIYNFLRFCANLWTWVTWGWNEIVAFIRRRQGYIRIDPENPHDTEHLLPERNKLQGETSWWTRIKQGSIDLYQKTYTWMFGRPHPQRRPQTTDIPLYHSEYFGQGDETSGSGISGINNRSGISGISGINSTSRISSKTQEERHFDHQLSQLYSDSTFSFGPTRPTSDSYYSPFIPTSSLPFGTAQTTTTGTHDHLDEQYTRKVGKSVYQSVVLYPPDNERSNDNGGYNYNRSVQEQPLDISLHDPLLSSSIFHPIPLDSPQNGPTPRFKNISSSMLFNSEFIKKNLNSKATSVQAVSNITVSAHSHEQRTTETDTNTDTNKHDVESEHSGHTTLTPIEIKKPAPPPKRLKHISQSFVPKGPMHLLSDSFDEELEQNPYI
ncbi:hypothetical protein EBU95_05730 [bacterium]|nr:hypothetical protein [bacterium]